MGYLVNVMAKFRAMQESNIAKNSMPSIRYFVRLNILLTDKIKGEVMDTAQFKISSDLKTMTVTVHENGQPKPLTIVYDRQ